MFLSLCSQGVLKNSLAREVSEPGFQRKCALQDSDGNVFVAASLPQRFRKSISIDDSHRIAGDVMSYLYQAGPFRCAVFSSLWWNKRVSPSGQEFVGNDADKSTLHQGTALAHADDLFPRDGVREFQEIPIVVGIAYLDEQV